MEKRLVRVSKYLATYFHHAPQELGLTLRSGGWVQVDDLLNAARRHGFPISFDELVECVETNDKQPPVGCTGTGTSSSSRPTAFG